MDPGEIQIQTVQRLDDGVIYERALRDGMRVETYYKPVTEESMELETFIKPSALDVGGSEGSVGTDSLSSGKKTLVESKCGFILFALFFYLMLFVIWAVIVNPFFIARIPQLTSGLDQSRLQLPTDVVWERIGCHHGPFCHHYSAPIIVTPSGTFYPNFTRDDGKPVDFLAVLSAALAVMSNRSCSDGYRLTLYEGNRIPRDYLGEFLHTVTWYMEKSKMLLSHNCHPEINFILDSGYRYRRYGDDRVLSLLKSPPPGPCRVNWTDLYRRSEGEGIRRRTLCAGDKLGTVGALNPQLVNKLQFS